MAVKFHDFDESVRQAANALKQARNTVRRASRPDPETLERIPVEEQVQEFLNMDQQTYNQMVARRGKHEVRRYIQAQMDNMRELGMIE